jgi:cellulose synthase/poly-beta-1,6-N-acetylglucosamine synthase-like glycosyltransferase
MGETLVAAGLLSPQRLAQRLEEASRTGTRLGEVLMAHGDVSRLELFDALARNWGLSTVDLVADPPAKVDGVDPAALLAQGWMPLSVSAATAWIAVCDEPGPELAAQVHGMLDVEHLQFVATTDWDIEQAVLAVYGDDLVERAAFELAETRPQWSAAEPLTWWQKALGVIALAVVGIGLAVSWRTTLMALLVVFNVMFFVGIVFKLVTVTAGAFVLRRRTTDGDGDGSHGATPPARAEDAELPRYTILVPAFHEANVVAHVVNAVSRLDYPLSKLQVLVLLEAEDVDTIAAAKAARPPDFVRLVVVPPGGPQTKPKACNVGLDLAEGEFLVIFDAEDRPEPGQLREAVAAFAASGPDTVCVQARLNYFNTKVNFLTRMFTLEYSAWFDYMLPGLDRLRLPIPLGGTSNHFRTAALRDLGGWDPFNVTEDADLGLRASADGHRVGIIDSTTWEEACSEWRAFIRQRTRWIKGYMVTAAVHFRSPLASWRHLGLRGWIGLFGLVAGTPALFLAAPLVWAFFLYTFLGGPLAGFALPSWLQWMTAFSLVVGNLSMIGLSALAAFRRKNYTLAGYAAFNPAYWVLHSIAAWRALYQLVVRPSHWEKTPHGITHGPHAQ